MKFSEFIKKFRQSRFLSQEDFAKEIGVSFTTVNRWETGKSKPTYRTKQLINNYCLEKNIAIDLSKDVDWDA